MDDADAVVRGWSLGLLGTLLGDNFDAPSGAQATLRALVAAGGLPKLVAALRSTPALTEGGSAASADDTADADNTTDADEVAAMEEEAGLLRRGLRSAVGLARA